jgi:hypothetical protein
VVCIFLRFCLLYQCGRRNNICYFGIAILEKKCTFFFRLEQVWGSRPNVRLPAFFDSGATIEAAGSSATRLIAGLNKSTKTTYQSPDSCEILDEDNINSDDD